MGKSFGGRLVAPNMAALAAEGSQVREAYSHVGFTTASLKSLFSGVLEPGPDSPSLFRDFKANGYKIGVFSGQAERFGDIESTVGMRRNSDIFVDAETLKEERAGAFTATASLLVDGQILLREFDRAFGRPSAWQKPAFLYFNFQSSHFPYHNEGVKAFLPGEPIPRGEIGLANKAWVARTYWNSVAYGDWLVGRVIARLKALGQYDDTLVVVTADHGESLFDDGFLGHGHMLNARQTHRLRRKLRQDLVRLGVLCGAIFRRKLIRTRSTYFIYTGELSRIRASTPLVPHSERMSMNRYYKLSLIKVSL
jgi:arylsulfatase A-like enzyme